MDIYGKGQSPRKTLGMMGKAAPDFGVAQMGSASTPHPDAKMGAAQRPAMSDGARGIGDSVQHTKGMLPAQAAPDHGPSYEREMGFRRGAKA